MKATFFQKPFEFNLGVQGESWRQGDPVSGELTLKNNGQEPFALSDLVVVLALGELKKARAKAAGAFTPVCEASGPAAQVAPGTQASFPWRFETEVNCPITDGSGSFFLLYGRKGALETMGNIQLGFKPHEVMDEFLDILSVQFRFVRKGTRFSKGRVVAKFEAPDAKAFAMVDDLILSLRFDGDRLEVEYEFRIRKIESSASANMELSKQKRVAKQSFSPADYRVPSGRINHERLEVAIREAVSIVESKLVFT